MSLRVSIAVTLLCLIPATGFADHALTVGTPNCNSNAACDCSCSCWTVTVEGLLMRRAPSASQPLTDIAPQWDVADFGFKYEPGARVSVVRHLDSPYDVELSYFGIFDQDSTKSRSDNFVSIIGPGFQYANFGAQPYRFAYETELHSLEANLRRGWGDHTTLIAGFRWLELDEDFDHAGDATPVYSLDTDNNLYGFQIGIESWLLPHAESGFRIEGFAKAGVYHNSANGLASSTGAFAGVPTGAAVASDDHVAFVGETGLVGVLPIRDDWSLRCGYQVLWIDGIATAPNQLPNFSTATSTATLNTSYSAFYHGGFLGVVGEF